MDNNTQQVQQSDLSDLNFKTAPDPNGDKFNSAIGFTLPAEGGYTVDSGGPTNHGITQHALDHFNLQNNYPYQDVKDATPDDAKFVYKKQYFQAPGFDQLPQMTATNMFDYGVNAGPNTAIKTLQNIVGAHPDGNLGPKTLQAVQKFIDDHGEDTLNNEILNQRQNHYNDLIDKNPAKYQKYEKGWTNRLNNLKQYLNLAEADNGENNG